MLNFSNWNWARTCLRPLQHDGWSNEGEGGPAQDPHCLLQELEREQRLNCSHRKCHRVFRKVGEERAWSRLGSNLSEAGSPLLWDTLLKGTDFHPVLAYWQSEVGLSFQLENLCRTVSGEGSDESPGLLLHGHPKSEADTKCCYLAVECLQFEILCMVHMVHLVSKPDFGRYKLLQASNLKDYKKEGKYMFPDLNQLCRNGRGRGETRDNCLPTLTTNSGKIYSQASVLQSVIPDILA